MIIATHFTPSCVQGYTVPVLLVAKDCCLALYRANIPLLFALADPRSEHTDVDAFVERACGDVWCAAADTGAAGTRRFPRDSIHVLCTLVFVCLFVSWVEYCYRAHWFVLYVCCVAVVPLYDDFRFVPARYQDRTRTCRVRYRSFRPRFASHWTFLFVFCLF